MRVCGGELMVCSGSDWYVIEEYYGKYYGPIMVKEAMTGSDAR